MEWLLETALLGLLAATLFHAMRLERALGVLKRDRAALEDLVVSFNSSTRAAEQGIERLHAAAEGAGRQVQRQAEVAAGPMSAIACSPRCPTCSGACGCRWSLSVSRTPGMPFSVN